MFYESSMIEEILLCSFCKERPTSVVKLIPECGNSICGECYKELLDSLPIERKYECSVCNELHIMPKRGLGDNKVLLTMLQLRSKEKSLSNKVMGLKNLIESVQGEMKDLKSIDETEELNAYYNELTREVTEALDRAVKHVNRLAIELIDRINKHKSETLDSMDKADSNQPGKRLKTSDQTPLRMPTSANNDDQLEALSSEIDRFVKQWGDHFASATESASEVHLDKAVHQVMNYNAKIVELETQIRAELSRKRSLKFTANRSFDQSTDLLGLMVVEHEYEEHTPKSLSPSSDTHENGFDMGVVKTLNGHGKQILQVLFLSNGLVASCAEDSKIRIWNVTTGQKCCELDSVMKCFLSLAELSNGWLAAGSDSNKINIWDIVNRSLKHTLLGHSGDVVSLRTLPNGYLASAALDDAIKIWNPYVKTNNLLITMAGHGIRYCLDLEILSNGNLVTCSSSSTSARHCMVMVWSPIEAKMVRALSIKSESASSMLVLSNDQVAVSFLEGMVRIFDLLEMKLVWLIKSDNEGFFALAELPNGHLATGGRKYDPSITIWDLKSQKLVHKVSTGHRHLISSMSISKDGQYLATGSYDRQVKILRLKN